MTEVMFCAEVSNTDELAGVGSHDCIIQQFLVTEFLFVRNKLLE